MLMRAVWSKHMYIEVICDVDYRYPLSRWRKLVSAY